MQVNYDIPSEQWQINYGAGLSATDIVDDYIVRFTENVVKNMTSAIDHDRFLPSGWKVIKGLGLPGMYLVRPIASISSAAPLSSSFFASVEKDQVIQLDPIEHGGKVSTQTNDSNWGSLWGLNPSLGPYHINCKPLWDAGDIGSDTHYVVVLDTGIDLNHPELQGNAAGQYGRNFIANDDGVTDPNDWMDRDGHGTHCAGTIGATGNNNRGVVGVCHKIKLIPVKVLNDPVSYTHLTLPTKA